MFFFFSFFFLSGFFYHFFLLFFNIACSVAAICLITYTYICIFIYMRSVILYITYMYMYIHAWVSSPLPPQNSHSISPSNEYSFCSHASGTPICSHTATRSFFFSFFSFFSLLLARHDSSRIGKLS